MVYIVINEHTTKGKKLLAFLRSLKDEKKKFVEFLEDENKAIEKYIDIAMETKREKSGNSLRAILK